MTTTLLETDHDLSVLERRVRSTGSLDADTAIRLIEALKKALAERDEAEEALLEDKDLRGDLAERLRETEEALQEAKDDLEAVAK